MARPKKIQADSQPATERDMAPVHEVAEMVVPAPQPYVAPQPRQMRIERQGGSSSPVSRRFPEVRGGVCEFHGVLDPNVPSQFQYKLCSHFRGMQLQCSYCPATKEPDEVIRSSNLKIQEHPDKPGSLVVWCDSYECSKAHLERFQVSRI